MMTDTRRPENVTMTGNRAPWQRASLAALDLEGTGAQDRDDEAILEIAVIPLADGHPELSQAYCTLINPQRSVSRRPWISPGLTTEALASAPVIADVEPELARRLSGVIIAGHNIGVDWRLLRRRCPSVRPVGLLDTLRLARLAHPGEKGNSLARLLDRHQLTQQGTQLASGSQQHRALWDATGAALLLRALVTTCYPAGASLGELLAAAGTDADDPSHAPASTATQGQLFT
jgi:DNA polymerase III subunit epsilon